MTGWALVTGSAKRIGRAIALHLAANGYDIILHYHRSADEAARTGEEIIKLGRQVALAEIDLAQGGPVAKLIPSLVAELGPITALVNNASLFERDDDDPDGARHHAINAEAPRLLSEAFYAQAPAEGAAIVNILDGMPPESGLDAYNLSKAALKAYTLESARRFAPQIRVNGIAPGPVLPNIRQSEDHFAAQVASTPLRRRIAPDDIARAAHFLLTAPAVTGVIVPVDGGRHL